MSTEFSKLQQLRVLRKNLDWSGVVLKNYPAEYFTTTVQMRMSSKSRRGKRYGRNSRHFMPMRGQAFEPQPPGSPAAATTGGNLECC